MSAWSDQRRAPTYRIGFQQTTLTGVSEAIQRRRRRKHGAGVGRFGQARHGARMIKPRNRWLSSVDRFIAAICGLAAGLVTGCASHASKHEFSRVPIVFTTAGDASGVIGGMAAPVAYDGRVSYLAIDTGSALSFLYLGESGPEYRPRVGRVRIGDEVLMLPGRGLAAADETAIGIIGVLGADYFVQKPCLFEPALARITRYPDGLPPSVAQLATPVPFEQVLGHILVRLTVDGRPLRLMWDTGCPHILWLGEAGRPGDVESLGEDVEGSRFPMYAGSGLLGLHGEPPRSVTVLRAPRFPYFEETVRALGGGIDGLAGQSVFGMRSMAFEPRSGTIHVGRLNQPE